MNLNKPIALIAGALIALSAMEAPTAINVCSDENHSLCAYASNNSFSSPDSAADYLRSCMAERSTNVVFSIESPGSSASEIFEEIFEMAVAETGKGSEGDYLRWNFKSYSYSVHMIGNLFTFTVDIAYRTTAAQESVTSAEIYSICNYLNLDGKSDYEKIRSIYDYVKNNVSYKNGTPSDVDFSAYGALVNGTAVCQGYCALTYRLLCEAGISARIIAGRCSGIAHGWLIVQLDGLYYNLDPTWDSENNTYDYFLKGSEDFDSKGSVYSHQRNILLSDGTISGINYNSKEFHELYPMSLYAYEPVSSGYPAGDVNGDGAVNSVDASIVLTAYAAASTGKGYGLSEYQLTAANVNNDETVNSVDSSAILSYYAYAATGGTEDIESFLNT